MTLEQCVPDRYEGLDWDKLKQSMSPSDFQLFKDFVGGENLNIVEDDFEIFYRED